ncbi:TIGR03503 family protein [Paraglaciecola sp. L3A3]|uniref:TIGR03503 family protein n=1 Tax=Paraglaciecola sp. L3A3 TaxID=2686358 RepID=UPI001E2B1566|nr:TIGR03503 family protein [Paraglaciecola sp. L3A3]
MALKPKKEVSPLTQLGNEFHNSIELLQNRFRIDYEVDEITMVFFREYGSVPIILVQPDGSKIFQSAADGENIFWFDTSTYDMISIKKPKLGPWQAIGNIVPGSRVMVISDLALHAEHLPELIFSGEILKQTAYLTNSGEPIDYTAFRDVVELTISLASTNNPNYNNFGAGSHIVATFQDNGKGMDEVPLDGVFTGQFNLSIADGEWIPTFNVSTPMYSREQVDPTIMLLPNPISVEVDIDDGKAGYHILKVDADREYVDISSLLIDGKVRYPNGDIQNFSITEMSDDVRLHEIVNFDFGLHRVKLTAFGNTLEGREFILDVPEYSFLVEEPQPEVIPPAAGTTDPAINPMDGQSIDPNIGSTAAEPLIVEEKMTTTALVSWIVGLNLFLLIIGGGLIWFIASDKKLSFALFKKSTKEQAKKQDEKKPGLFTRLFTKKTKETKPTEDNNKESPAPKDATDSGFVDLAMPKE